VFSECTDTTIDPVSTGGALPDKPQATCDKLKIEYKFPQYSVHDKIRLFRDGLPDNGTGDICRRPAVAGTGCPITGVPIDQGICPAIKEILTLWPVLPADMDHVKELWVQASFGRFLTADDIQNMFVMMQSPVGSLRGKDFRADATWNSVNQRFMRWLSVYCDASAVAAFKKYHYRMMSIVEDALRINQKASDYEKERVRDLMSRITSDIQLAESDVEASAVSSRVLSGSDVETDRTKMMNQAATVEAAVAARQNAQTLEGLVSFNGVYMNPAAP
jgi:hypothetical protein